jgi:hypothetical protein
MGTTEQKIEQGSHTDPLSGTLYFPFFNRTLAKKVAGGHHSDYLWSITGSD